MPYLFALDYPFSFSFAIIIALQLQISVVLRDEWTNHRTPFEEINGYNGKITTGARHKKARLAPRCTALRPTEFNSLTGTLKPQSNGPLYNNTVIGTLAVDGWLLHLVQRKGALAGCGPAQSPLRCIKCNSQPINGQCTNFIL